MRIITILFCFICTICLAQTSSPVKTDNLEYYIQNKKIGLRDKTTKQMIISCKYDYIGGFNKSGLSVVKNNGLWGFVNTKGQEVIKLQYQEAKSFSADYKLAPVKKGEKWGFINMQGLVKINFQYDDVYSIFEGIASVKKNDKWGAINTLGREVIPFVYDEKFYFAKDGYAVVNKDKKWGTIAKNGKIIHPNVYDSKLYFNSDGLAESKKDNKYGVVKMDGTEILPCQYKEVDYIQDGVIWIKQDDKWCLVDYSGKRIVDFRYKYVRGFQDGIAGVSDEHGAYLISKDTRTIHSFPNVSLIFPIQDTTEKKMYELRSSSLSKSGIVDESGKMILPIKYDDVYAFYGNNLIAVKDNKWGFYDANGIKKIPHLYDEVYYHFFNGLVAAKKGEKWGIINESNIVVCPFEYDAIESRRTSFQTKKNGQFGALDENGTVLLECKYDDVDWFVTSLRYFPVKLNGKDGYADVYGNDTF